MTPPNVVNQVPAGALRFLLSQINSLTIQPLDEARFSQNPRPRTGRIRKRKPNLCNRHKSRRHRQFDLPGRPKITYIFTYVGSAKRTQFQTNLKHSYERHERVTRSRSHRSPHRICRMQFATGRPILAVIFLDEHRNPFTAHIERFRDCARNGHSASARFFSIGHPLAEPDRDRDHRHGRRQRPSSRTSTKWPAIAAAAAMAGDTR